MKRIILLSIAAVFFLSACSMIKYTNKSGEELKYVRVGPQKLTDVSVTGTAGAQVKIGVQDTSTEAIANAATNLAEKAAGSMVAGGN